METLRAGNEHGDKQRALTEVEIKAEIRHKQWGRLTFPSFLGTLSHSLISCGAGHIQLRGDHGGFALWFEKCSLHSIFYSKSNVCDSNYTEKTEVLRPNLHVCLMWLTISKKKRTVPKLEHF